MKRLPAYLFIILSLGFVFNINAYSKIYCVDDKIEERLKNFKEDYSKRENEFFFIDR